MENAELFYKQPENQREQDNEAMHGLIAARSPNSLLEIGCGSGDMLNRYDNSRGIDINRSMVEFAQKRGNNVVLGDVTDSGVMEQYLGIDVIAANYVFTELKAEQIKAAFKNIQYSLRNQGTFYFTITNPQTRHREDLPGYKVVFDEQFKYERKDIPFTVLLEDEDGKLRDVGIRDFHNPIGVYQENLYNAGFLETRIHELSGKNDFVHALLFECKK